MQGSSGGENPSNSLSSLLASFASGHGDEDNGDDNSQLPTEGNQAEEAPPQRARGPNTFGGGRKRKTTSASAGGQSASKTPRSEVPEEGATAGKMIFSIWNLLSNLFISASLPSLPKISFLSPTNCIQARSDRTWPRGPGRDHTSAGPLGRTERQNDRRPPNRGTSHWKGTGGVGRLLQTSPALATRGERNTLQFVTNEIEKCP